MRLLFVGGLFPPTYGPATCCLGENLGSRFSPVCVKVIDSRCRGVPFSIIAPSMESCKRVASL